MASTVGQLMDTVREMIELEVKVKLAEVFGAASNHLCEEVRCLTREINQRGVGGDLNREASHPPQGASTSDSNDREGSGSSNPVSPSTENVPHRATSAAGRNTVGEVKGEEDLKNLDPRL